MSLFHKLSIDLNDKKTLIFNENIWENSLLLAIVNVLLLRNWIDISNFDFNNLDYKKFHSQVKKIIVTFIVKRFLIEFKVSFLICIILF